MSHKFSDNFDYEEARLDLIDNGIDPDYLNERDPSERDRFLKKNGLNPKDYGSKWVEPSPEKSKSSSDSLCYLTTACIVAKDLPDDCEELQLLRAFRDNYLRKTERGEEEIAEYYAIAPGIVTAVNNLSNANKVWNELYNELILPCVAGIKAGEFEKVHEMYRSSTLKLKEVYC